MKQTSGKNCEVTGFTYIKSSYGTVNHNEFKSIFINIRTWVTPKIESDNWKRVDSNLRKDITRKVSENINKIFFKEHFIVIVDIPTNNIRLNKKTFVQIDITLFLKTKIEFKSIFINRNMKKLIKTIYNDVLKKNEYLKLFKEPIKNILL